MFKRLLHLSARANAATFEKSLKMHEGKALKHVVKALEEFAPLALAEKWDNVGLLIKPYRQRIVRKIMLTNDLTERVMQEAVDKNTDLIISYHPPIFAPLKRIAQDNWKERIVSRCLAESMALYSPHTAWDAVPNGINDWLASAFPCENIKPIQPNPNAPEGTGAGRVFTTSITLADAISSMQKHIGLDVHVAIGVEQTLNTIIKKVAVCAGSGGSLLKDVTADLYVTGEMSHHDILDAQHLNTSIILCNHSNSERGFLQEFKKKLNTWFGDECEVIISTQDEDPLKTFVKNF